MSEKKQEFLKQEYLDLLKRCFQQSDASYEPDYSSQVQEYKSMSKLAGSKYFFDLLIEKNRDQDNKKPVVGYFCNLVPEEIIIACGAVPVRLCSSDSCYARKGENILPGDICPVLKSISGTVYSKKYEKLDLIVVPAACDGKMKLAEVLAPLCEIYFFDVPKDSDYVKNADIWEKMYNDFYNFIKQRYNKSVSRRELLDACKVTNKRTSIFRQIYDFRLKNPGIINSLDYFTMAYASFFTEPSIWIENAQKLYNEACTLADKEKIVFKGKRIILSGAPIIFPNFKILKLLENLGCDVSADTLCSAYGRLYDPVKIDEETESAIIRALSLKYIAASMCPCFIGVNKLIDHIINTVKENSISGVIYHNLRLCQVFEFQTVLIRQVLKGNGIPSLFLKSDLGNEDIGQLTTRIEAFLEMLGENLWK